MAIKTNLLNFFCQYGPGTTATTRADCGNNDLTTEIASSKKTPSNLTGNKLDDSATA